MYPYTGRDGAALTRMQHLKAAQSRIWETAPRRLREKRRERPVRRYLGITPERRRGCPAAARDPAGKLAGCRNAGRSRRAAAPAPARPGDFGKGETLGRTDKPGRAAPRAAPGPPEVSHMLSSVRCLSISKLAV